MITSVVFSLSFFVSDAELISVVLIINNSVRNVNPSQH